MLSANVAQQGNNTAQQPVSITIGNQTYRLASHNVKYSVKPGMTKAQKGGALVDSGANGGLRGKDMRVMGTTGCKVDVSGIEDFTIEELDLAHCTAVIRLKTGKKIIGHFYQYADMDYG
jgi:hypothetical protein